MARPVVSVVTATYNRSNALALAIASVRWQSFANWELLVVGDACTDDTAEVVAACRDPRIQFINLPQNIGEQSGPNNVGVAQARGSLIAFLNHDDLWLPNHLSTAVEGLMATGASLVFTLAELVRRDKPSRLLGATRRGRYEPNYDIRASTWLFRRSLYDDVGPWRSARDCRTVPSQDWLFRAWRRGHELCGLPRLTAVVIQSGGRPNVYERREDHEHRAYFERIRSEPDFAEREWAAMALAREAETPVSAWKRLAIHFGLHPLAVRNLLHLRGGRQVIDRLRRSRGLSPLPQSQPLRKAA